MSTAQAHAQPVVIIGGFLSYPSAYSSMWDALRQITGQPVLIVRAYTHHWARLIHPRGWPAMLDRLAHTVQRALAASETGKVTLVGHSAGGTLARLYLGRRPFKGRVYAGQDHVSDLITLGSPHHSPHTWMQRWVETRYPGAYFTPQVAYTAVAGQIVQGRPEGTFWERRAFTFYRYLCGDGRTWGDGLVPVQTALLRGARPLVLENVAHYGGLGLPWYGSPEVVALWWDEHLKTLGRRGAQH